MARKTLAFVALALAAPGVALAATANPPNAPATRSAPKVMYVLTGTLWSYTAATSGADGSITIHFTHSNYHGRALRGADLTFAVSRNTTITFKNGASTINDGARGMVKFRGPKNTTNARLLAALSPNHTTAVQVIAEASSRSDSSIPRGPENATQPRHGRPARWRDGLRPAAPPLVASASTREISPPDRVSGGRRLSGVVEGRLHDPRSEPPL